MDVKGKRILIVGCGPGSPDHLTPAARQAAEKADVLVGAAHLLALFPAVKAERFAVSGEIDALLDEIATRCSRGRVAVLVTGDPGLYSFARPVLSRFGREMCEVIPGISSVQVAFARLGLSWHDAVVVSAHARPIEWEGRLGEADKIAVLAGGEVTGRRIGELLERIGEGRRLFLCENLTMPGERVSPLSPAELTRWRPAGKAIILILKEEVLS
ncbi:MAG: precorrin-6y C5,15-methyltransferase (decarboxylating) subunit CbiE [Deltaproteobacteria bacterium]|uniref:precorrin-6y C5,15-methyltransferase (decarboxylating) subunit CbiE n=1 Tax=Candidatus Deferrimicrobium sp. TaxID=3060586 RepID=UPI0027226907|nr:precorrin-6y C5,15-methyltransferase (decarboxylating) subunit CbiE [Candidatus Deferrimicrobium sp.]MCR4309547.1 precorrin-6y C5,15-methyltransferase (decarboxylating) subunit CbiE [Deltaproteobacteria bacterium]MDO8739727.1 precorrin-6y C5,15-methyltransferase (decarboxylating) subunit CbiE [Candidatus Deferrimicrobium sp.]